MGQKTNPIGFRVGVTRPWASRWYARRGRYAMLLNEDVRIRKFLEERLSRAGLSRTVIERSANKVRIEVHAARPGVIIGKKGADIEKLRKDLGVMTGGEVSLNIVDVRKPEIDARLVADNIAHQLERRISFRRAMKRAVQAALRLGVGGIRVNVRGRLGGAEIARMEWYREGRVPLHTLRADIDYGTATARTTYGACGVKVWIYIGEQQTPSAGGGAGETSAPTTMPAAPPTPPPTTPTTATPTTATPTTATPTTVAEAVPPPAPAS